MLMQMRVYQICNRHRLGKQGSASALLFVPWLWEREIKMGFSAAQRDGRREAETAGCTYANCQGKTWSAALGSAALFLLDSGDMPPVTVGDSGICSWFGFESCERCYREISVWLISGQRRRFFFFFLTQIVLFCLFCSISLLWDLPIHDGGRCLGALTTLGRCSFPPCRALSEESKTTFDSKRSRVRTKFVELTSVRFILFYTNDWLNMLYRNSETDPKNTQE